MAAGEELFHSFSALVDACRPLCQSLSRPYQRLLDALPDTRTNSWPGIVASTAFHLIALAVFALWSSSRQPGFANESRSVLVDLVAQPSNPAKGPDAPDTTFPTPTIEPSERQLKRQFESPDLSTTLPLVDVSTSSQAAKDLADVAPPHADRVSSPKNGGVDVGDLERAQSQSSPPSKKGNAKDLADSLRDQIMACWNAASGSAEKISVDFDLYFNPDGSISQPPQLTAAYSELAVSDPAVQAEADALRRAIYTCAPYRLPSGRYDDWRAIRAFHFGLSKGR